jgi:hypothetical protein
MIKRRSRQLDLPRVRVSQVKDDDLPGLAEQKGLRERLDEMRRASLAGREMIVTA